MMIPAPVKKGDKVAVIAPATTPSEEKLNGGVAYLESLGLKPVVFESCRSLHGFFAGDDELRAADLMESFTNNEYKAVICARGGYGTQRLLKKLDFDAIAAHPKRFFGYSDITALHIAIAGRCRYVTYHSPMPASEFYGECDDLTKSQFEAALFGDPLCDEIEGEAYIVGDCEGQLYGGNLSLVASLVGTPYMPDMTGKILFLEDVDERPYTIDRMMTQLRNAGVLDACAGLVLGYFTNCGLTDYSKSLTVDEVFAEQLADFGKPVLRNVKFGHDTPTYTLPEGAHVRICGGKLELL